MRAVVKLNHNCSTLHNSLDSLNFIAMAGVFNDVNFQALVAVHRVAQRPGADGNTDEILNSIAEINDKSIEFILKYPALEYAENSLDFEASIPQFFVERLKSAPTSMSPNKEVKLQEITTPRTTNKTQCSISLRA